MLGLGILIYLGLILYKGKIPLPFLDKIINPSSTQNKIQPQSVSPNKDLPVVPKLNLPEVIASIHIPKSGPAKFIKKESISTGTHFNNITEKPKSSKD